MRGGRRSVLAAVKRALVVFLVVAPLAGGAAAAPLPSRRSEIVEVVDKVSPAVVNIAAEQTVRRRPSMFDEFFFGMAPRARRTQSLGSGVIIRSEGIILTNDHVISGASRILATTKSGQELECDVIGSDADNDLAVLRVRNSRATLPTIRLGTSSDLLIGETIVAIGNPFGLSNTVTAGVVSALGRSVPGENQRMYTDFVQIDAPINPGNSGGPLLNARGEVIGINSLIESPVEGSVGIGFALEINVAKRLLPVLQTGAQVEPVWLGISGIALDASIAAEQGLSVTTGVLVASVVTNGPAAKAGIRGGQGATGEVPRGGDVVTHVDRVAVRAVPDITAQLSGLKPGDTVELTILRDGRTERIVVTLEPWPTGQGG